MSAVILDIDGTLVDTNYQHALAWFRAFRAHDLTVPIWRIHRAIGMGGDKLIEEVAGAGAESDLGDAIRESEGPEYMEMIGEVVAFEGATELLAELSDAGHELILASSAKAEEVDHYVDLLDARDHVVGWTTSADVEETKPEPDLVHAALDKTASEEAVMIGDSVWDVHAAKRAGVPTIAVLTGGYSEAELRDAGAVECFESIQDLRETPGAVEAAAASPPD